MGYVQTFDTVSTRAEKLAAGAMLYVWNANTMFASAPAQAEFADTSSSYQPEMVADLLKAQLTPAVDAPKGAQEFMDWLNTP
jgi:hypothetical protein